MRLGSVVILGVVSAALAGCGAGSLSSPALNTQPDTLQGHAFGGQQAVSGATVTVYVAGTSGYGTGATALASTTTDADGAFNFTSSAYTCPSANAPIYLVATGGDSGSVTNHSLALAAVIGACSAGRSASVFMNEVTTAATVLAMGQFMGTTLGEAGNAYNIGGTCLNCAAGTYNLGLVNAMAVTYPQLVNNVTGAAVPSSVSGSLTLTTEAAKINSMANVLAACVNSAGATSTTETGTPCGMLFTGVNATGASPRPSDTLQAALQMVLYPYYNVSAVYGLGAATGAPFVGLSVAPSDWTVALSFATSSFGLGIAQNTSSSLDIDAAGNVWFPSNMSGSSGIAYFDPSSASFHGPYGSFQSEPPFGITIQLRYPQYVVIDQRSPSYTWATDIGSNLVEAVNVGSQINIQAYTPSQFDTGGPLTVDVSDNIVFSGGSTIYQIPAGSSSLSQVFQEAASAQPNGLAISLDSVTSNGAIFAADTTSGCNNEFLSALGPGSNDSLSTGDSTCVTGGILALPGGLAQGSVSTTSTGDLCVRLSPLMTVGCAAFSTLNNPKGLALDGSGNVWVANAGNASVAEFMPTNLQYPTVIGGGYFHGQGNGATATAPYGIGIDASGNIWLTNASCVATSSTRCNPTGITVTEIVGAAAPTVTPKSKQNTPSGAQSTTRPTS